MTDLIFENKRIAVTGGTGSLGKVLVRRLLSGKHGNPEKIIVFSRDEAKQHDMRLDYLKKRFSTDDIIFNNFKQKLEFQIGDIRDYTSVLKLLKNVDIVINAAALKQVPTCEYFPFEAVKTNIIGAENIVNAINNNDLTVEVVVGVSTDKACKPINAMGLTKAILERIFIAANLHNKKTRYVCVRYGNVLASRGSVIPLFHEQIKNGGPLTITTEKMTRFLLPLEHAVDTIIFAIKNAKKGDIIVPKVTSSRIYDVAKALIQNKNIEIKITGIRPGEKIDEIMISEEEIVRTENFEGFYAIHPMLNELVDYEFDKANLDKEYSSADNVLSFDETITLLNKNNLINEFKYFDGDELLA